MRHNRRRAAIAAVAIALSMGAAGGVVVAGTQSSDERALKPARQSADRSVERRVNRLLARMTLEEKLQQMALLPDFKVAGAAGEAEARNGLGSVLSLTDPARIRRLQEIAVEESRLGIPILFAFDTIHGYRTVFPIPLGTGASFDPKMAATDSKFGSRESTAVGLKQTYAPMVDVSHEPRWGRISEGAGEDPYLNSVMGAARVKGIQGRDYSKLDRMIASPKHFAAYGEPEAGRDYATTDMSLSRLWNMYLPPFKASIDAGADTIMCSFNSINGSPGCGNSYLMNDVLKGQWRLRRLRGGRLDGGRRAAGLPAAKPGRGRVRPRRRRRRTGRGRAGAQRGRRLGDDERADPRLRRAAARAAPDLDAADRRRGAQDPAGEVPCRPVREPVRAVHAGGGRGADAEAGRGRGRSHGCRALDGAAAQRGQRAAARPVEEDGRDRPARQQQARHARPVVGPRRRQRRGHRARTASTSRTRRATTYAEGCQLSNGEVPFAADPDPKDRDPEGCQSDAGFAEAVAVASAADQVVLARRRDARDERRGERPQHARPARAGRRSCCGRSRRTGKPVAVVLFNGRPLALENIMGDAPAILEAWFPGVQAGPAVADVVFGKVNPGGKLPASFPYRVGQVPIYYNHEPGGRPCNKGVKWNSQHRDIPSCDPLFVFGHGLSYTTFETSNLRLSSSRVSRNGTISASVDVRNTGGRAGDEVVQLYINDPVATLSQPVRRLRGFERVTLEPGQRRTVTFKLDKSDFGFYDNRGKFVVERGQIDVYAGNSSKAELKRSFTVTG